MSESVVAITAAEAICALGDSLNDSLQQWAQGTSGLTQEDGLLAGRIRDRSLLKGRRYGAASNVAIVAARAAAKRAGWDLSHCDDVWLFAASSRGNAGELLQANDWRRGSRRFRASNTMHSEIAAAVSIELGLRGPWQMIANGCSGGLDALGMAWMALKAGVTRRALVVAVDLPLVPQLVRDFRETRLLSASGQNDPLCAGTDGFNPGEAAAAVTLELNPPNKMGEIVAYAANSDAFDSLAVPADGAALAALLRTMSPQGGPDFICPHATGTANHATGELAALRGAFGEAIPPLLLLKPFTGHTLAASGLLDVALIAGLWAAAQPYRNLAGLHAPGDVSLAVPAEARTCLKIASGMGGHNAAMLLRRPG